MELHTEVLLPHSQELDDVRIDADLSAGLLLLGKEAACGREAGNEDGFSFLQEIQHAGKGRCHFIGSLVLVLSFLLVTDDSEGHEGLLPVLAVHADSILGKIADNLDSLHGDNN